MHSTNITIPILLAIAEIGGLLFLGGLCRRLGYIDERDIDRWSKLTLDFLYPAFTFTSIIAGFQAERLGELWTLPVIGFGIALVGFPLGLLLRYGLGTPDKNRIRTFLYGCMVNNYGFLPIVIVSNLYDKTMLANLFFLTLGSTLVQWTLGIAVLGSGTVGVMARNLFTPNLVAIVAGILVSILDLDRYIPQSIEHVLHSAGVTAVPLMLILSGATMFRRYAFRADWQVCYLTMVRLVLLPAAVIAIMKLLPLPQDVVALATIVALMPLAVSQTIFTRIYGGDPEFAARSSVVSTLAGIITIPLALWILYG